MFHQNSRFRKSVLAVCALLAASAFAEDQKATVFDFAKYNENNWIAVRDPAVKEIGKFVQKDGFIQNFVKPEHVGSSALEAGHALRLLKDCTFKDGRLETELMLVGRAAPSIYFKTRIDKDAHKDTYNLVVFDYSGKDNPDYRGFNLWKWKEKWPATAKSYSNWLLLGSWSFPVPLNEKVKIAVETAGPDIKVFYNGQLKGSVYDPEFLPEGLVGLCSCEGMNNFYNFSVSRK